MRRQVEDGRLLKCVKVWQQVTKYRDVLITAETCVQKAGEGEGEYSQNVRAYSSGYNEIVIRNEVVKIEN